MHLFKDSHGASSASHLYHQQMSGNRSYVLKSLVWRRASDGSLQVTKPTLWRLDEPMTQFITTCREMGHEPLYCITLRKIAEHR